MINSVFGFTSFASKRSRQWCDWRGLRGGKSLQILREKPECSFNLSAPRKPLRTSSSSRHTLEQSQWDAAEETARSVRREQRGSRDAASSVEDPGTQQTQRNASWCLLFRHISSLIQHIPAFSCYSTRPPCLLRLVISFNSPYNLQSS